MHCGKWGPPSRRPTPPPPPRRPSPPAGPPGPHPPSLPWPAAARPPPAARGSTDRVMVRLVPGQSADDCAPRAPTLAHGSGGVLCGVRSAAPGVVVLEFVRRDALAATIPALSIGERADLRALPVGRRED